MTTPAMCARSLLVSLAAAGVFAANGSIEQTTPGKRPPVPIVASFDGLGGRNPSDNTLAVGPRHVFQIVNSQMAVYTKTGERVYGPLSTNTMFAGFGGVCEARPNGDAVVRYDQLAGRWLVVMPIFRRTIFPADRSSPGAPAKPGEAARPGSGRPGPPPPPPPPPPPGQNAPPQPREGTYAMCYAISTSADPLGTYHRYAFERPLFPDYPRPAVWPDGYYVPTSTSDNRISETVATQKHACVVDRAKMLKGEPAAEQCEIMLNVGFLHNADIDGKSAPPDGAPNVMMAA